jgi:hypothetical protein
MHAQQRPRRALARFAEAVPDQVIAPPPTPERIAFLIQEAGPLAPGLDAYLAVCDGVAQRTFVGPDGARYVKGTSRRRG